MTLTRLDPNRVAAMRRRRILLSMLSLLALAVGMFVMTSMNSTHPHEVVAASVGSQSNAHPVVTHAHIAPPILLVAPAASAPVSLQSSPGPQCDTVCELSCAIAGAACVLVVIAAAVSLFAVSRGLALGDLVQRFVPVAISSITSVRAHGPSLVALSVSRT